MTMESSLRSDSPSEQEASPLRRRAIILWLVAIGAAVLLIPLYLIFATIRSDAARLEARAEALQQTLQSPSTPIPENQELANQLAEAQERLSQVNQASSNLEAQGVDWPAVMSAIGNYNPAQMALTSVETGNSITLRGRAVNDTVVVNYSRGLEETGLFSRVVVQSLQTIATPFATPTTGVPQATATPTRTVVPTATATALPVFEDQYEVDDFRPVPIILGLPQERNFHPLFDVDRVKFLAKAGRHYRVSTSDLSPGVDTFLTVDLGGTRYTNDDRQAGELASELMIQGRETDNEAFVRVSNRGLYGPDMRYELLVEEFIPTPTPTATGTPLPPTATNTPTPTATAIPPSATPDPRDEYEPDDTSPSSIAIGEVQLHNFMPEGDVDNVEFLAKAGRWYRVFTWDLAQGVDTHLAVVAGGNVYTNDDREPTDLSSEVVFQGGEEDVDALVKITNRGQFGELKTYHVVVEEIIRTPTPSPTPTPTLTPVPEATATPDLRDEYEPDDTSPGRIALGEIQAHNFFPEGDVDQVEFLAKAGRWYRVATSNLALKTDTDLKVTLEPGGGTQYVYTNDDRAPGELSSEIVFYVETVQDVLARVMITNLGQYGPDQTYDITVEEVDDPRDQYEPDDAMPKPIAIGEAQQHNFMPEGDVDKVEFLAKAGRWYRMSTSGLAQGVDTYLAVVLDDIVHSNDDRVPLDLSSELVFQTGAEDVDAVAKITNRGEFGESKVYTLTLREMIPTPTPVPLPTETPTPVPDYRDPYEPDETSPSPIMVGQTQTHNFYPEGDVDRVKFRAKAGRWYRVSTSQLGPRVDTSLLLTYTLGTGDVYARSNDDRSPADLGDYSSELVFHVDTVRDVTAYVRIINLGQYGPEQAYDITVEEVYPDLLTIGQTKEGLSFELPTDGLPRDLVQFVAKENRTYVITTSQLAPGVDTSVTAFMDGEVVAGPNDDYLPDSYASRVQLTAQFDGVVLVQVTNLQKQYGPGKTYAIHVADTTFTSQPSLKVPGLAAPAASHALVDEPRYAIRRDRQPRRSPVGLHALAPPLQDGAVEFVIVLELAP